MSSNITSLFSTFFQTVHADAPEDKEVVNEKEGEAKEEEAEEEPEDIHPIIREECKVSSKCAALTKHFEHCQERVNSGKGFKGEDCVEELMMHCVDECTAPKLFAKLK